MGIFKWLLKYVIRNLTIIFGLTEVIVTFVTDFLVTSAIFSKVKLFSLSILVICIILEFLDKKVFRDSKLYILYNRYMSWCKKSYIRNINNKLTDKEKNYSNQIFKYCVDKSKFFK